MNGEREIVCIVCPSSCRMTVAGADGKITVTGNECGRGLEYGRGEYVSPMRMLSTTVAISGGALPRLPVISEGEIPKVKIGECLELLYRIEVSAPITASEIIAKNICDTGVNIVASRSLGRRQE